MSVRSNTPIGHILDELFVVSLLSKLLSVRKSLPELMSTDQTLTQSPVNLAVNQSGAYFQNFENSQKIEEIMYDYNFFTNVIKNKGIH